MQDVGICSLGSVRTPVMQTILIGTGCVWLLAAIAFLFAICRSARRPIPHPEADGIPDTEPASSAQDHFGDFKKAPRTVVVPTATTQPRLEEPVLREAQNGAS